MRAKLFLWINTECWAAKYGEKWITKTVKIDYEWVRAKHWTYKKWLQPIMTNIVFFQARLAGTVKYDDGSIRDRDGFHKACKANPTNELEDK